MKYLIILLALIFVGCSIGVPNVYHVQCPCKITKITDNGDSTYYITFKGKPKHKEDDDSLSAFFTTKLHQIGDIIE